MMRTVVITGAGGFIGGALTKRLLENGVTVYGADISGELLKRFQGHGNFIPVVASFDNYERLPELIGNKEIDVFYHLAWQGVFGEAFRDYALQMDNAKHACLAMEQAIRMGAGKFVLAGTYNEFEVRDILFSEDIQPRYTCIYAASKLAADMICKTLAYHNGIRYNAGLACMAYGQGNRSRMLANVLLDSFIMGVRPKLVEGDNLYDFIYIDDLVDAYLAIGEKGRDLKSYYIGHRELKTFREWVEEIKEILAPEMELVFGEYRDTQSIDYSRIDLEALYRDTGFECGADFRTSILRTAEWLEQSRKAQKTSPENTRGGGIGRPHIPRLPSHTAAQGAAA